MSAHRRAHALLSHIQKIQDSDNRSIRSQMRPGLTSQENEEIRQDYEVWLRMRNMLGDLAQGLEDGTIDPATDGRIQHLLKQYEHEMEPDYSPDDEETVQDVILLREEEMREWKQLRRQLRRPSFAAKIVEQERLVRVHGPHWVDRNGIWRLGKRVVLLFKRVWG